MNKKIVITLLITCIAILASYYFIIIQKSNNEQTSITNEINTENNNEEIAVKKELMNIEVSSFREISVGAVDIGVDFINPNKKIEDYWFFKISLDTHNVDLDAIDLKKSISFMIDKESIIKDAFEIKKTGSGHHISQFIELPKLIDGKETITSGSDSFKIIFENIDGIEKAEIEWDMTKYPNIFEN